ncbi:unnamed protein product [Darwinula stevensoni]|uniref:SAM domain-containing protein n=1 Tax=Darwinula stevensoni TaxID=69355 RepID=A0A7R9A5N8_9CRUS|nr:unnamed protein product [Darwinula stevensoni]CAG0885627.1 unnamed protein product [Darwinula stevensoni]
MSASSAASAYDFDLMLIRAWDRSHPRTISAARPFSGSDTEHATWNYGFSHCAPPPPPSVRSRCVKPPRAPPSTWGRRRTSSFTLSRSHDNVAFLGLSNSKTSLNRSNSLNRSGSLNSLHRKVMAVAKRLGEAVQWSSSSKSTLASPNSTFRYSHPAFTFPRMQSPDQESGISSGGSSSGGSGPTPSSVLLPVRMNSQESRRSFSSLDSSTVGTHRLSGQSFSSSSSSSSSSLAVVSDDRPSLRLSHVNIHFLISQGVPDSEVLNVWLSDLGLQEYYPHFIKAGYDMPTISRMTPEDLTAIGITKPAHRKRLKAEIAKLNISDGLPDHIPESLNAWLHELGLSEYLPTLLAQGFATVDQVLELQWEDLEEIGISRLGHQKKVMLAIKRMKEILSGKRRPSHSDNHSPRRSSFSQEMIAITPHKMHVSPILHSIPPDTGGGVSIGGSAAPYVTYHKQASGGSSDRLYMNFPPQMKTFHFPDSPPGHPLRPTRQISSPPFFPQVPAIYRRSFEDSDLLSSTRQVQQAQQVVSCGGGTLPRPAGINGKQRPVAKITAKVRDDLLPPPPPPPPPPSCHSPPIPEDKGFPPLPPAHLLSPPSTDGSKSSFRPRRQDSSCSVKSTSSTESDSLPFANEDAGTIKQRSRHQQQQQQPSQQDSPSGGATAFWGSSPKQKPRSADDGSGDVLNDIGNMLADLTDELDAMLQQENQNTARY